VEILLLVTARAGEPSAVLPALDLLSLSDLLIHNPITVADVLNSRMIAYPFRLLQCCLVTDGGGAIVLTTPDRAKSLKKPPVYVLGCGSAITSTRFSMRIPKAPAL